MDGDGEDNPDDLPLIIKNVLEKKNISTTMRVANCSILIWDAAPSVLFASVRFV